jgi:hypothetical protein
LFAARKMTADDRGHPNMHVRYGRVAIATLGGVAALGLLSAAASAAPTNAKNAFPGHAQCDNGQSYDFVVNNANGQGQGAQNNGQNQGEWAPAHLSNGQVFHPVTFNTTFTFTPVSGPSMSFTNTDSRPNQTGTVTCMISGGETDSAGNTFSLTGSVIGTIT